MSRLFSTIVVLSLNGLVSAQTYSVINPGFEDVVLGDGASSSSVPGWSLLGSSLTLNPTSAMFPAEAPEGQNIFSLSNSILATQGLGAIVPGTYKLEAKVGLISAGVFNNMSFRLRGNTILLAASSSSTPIPAPGTFEDWSLTYIVLPTNANASAIGTNLNIMALASSASGNSSAIDDIRLTFTAVPEPSTYALLGITVLAGCCCYLRWRMQQSARYEQVLKLR